MRAQAPLNGHCRFPLTVSITTRVRQNLSRQLAKIPPPEIRDRSATPWPHCRSRDRFAVRVDAGLAKRFHDFLKITFVPTFGTIWPVRPLDVAAGEPIA